VEAFGWDAIARQGSRVTLPLLIWVVSPSRRAEIEAMSSSLGHGAGMAFILVGIVFVVVATIRFVRTGYRLDDKEFHPPGITLELSLSVILALLLITASAPFVRPLL